MVFAATGTPIRRARRDGLGESDERLVHDVIAEWVRRRPDAVALRMVDLTGSDVWTYRQLWERVGRIRDGAFADLPFGSRVVMAQAGDADYVAGFIAALAAGLIPVPLFLPSADAPERFVRRAQHILRDCEPAAIYTSADLAEALGRDALLDGLAIRTPDSTPSGPRRSPEDAGHPAERVGFLQYTSGSTGEPKGIVNTHASMLHQRAIGLALWNSPEEIRTVSWLPLYHDLGIFWGVLLALATGGTATVIPPFDFVRNPRIWLETVHQVRGNWVAGPDFAYRLCLDAFDDAAIAALDLTCLSIAINGAEPVRPTTLRDFAAKFAPAGLRADVMTPQYGLAEAGLAVSGTTEPRVWVQASFDAEQLNRGRAVRVDGPSAPDRRVHTLVSCGDSTLGWDVRIIDPERRIMLPDGEVGEIWVGGSGLPDGYWGRPEQTAETFRASTADGSGPYLRTGDAGVRCDGELYICGRYRDLIIVAGGNYFPNDIELTVEEAGCGIDSGGACAVQPVADQLAVDQSAADHWWLIVETDSAAEDLDDLSRILRRRVLAAHQTAPERIIWVRPRVLPRTTSGKIRRRKALTMLDGAKFDVIQEFSSAPESVRACASELAEFLASLLGSRVEDLGGDLIALGLTSMMTAQVVEWAAARSRRLDFADLYAQPTLRDWQRLYDVADSAPTPVRVAADTFPTTALQRAYWIGRGADQPLGGVGCQTYFELGGALLDPGRLGTALDALARRHPMLRCNFPDADSGRVAPDPIHAPLRVHNLTDAGGSVDHHLAEVRRRLRNHRFDIAAGDTWRVEMTRLPDRCILHFAIDLIIADLTSIGVLLGDLAALYRGDELAAFSEAFAEPPDALSAEAAEWLPESPQLPSAEERDIVFRRRDHLLDAEAITALDDACRAHRVTRAAVFLAAYEQVLRRWSSTEDFLINVTTFGRPAGVPGVVGDFTKTHLYRAGVGPVSGFAAQAVRTQQGLRAALSAPESTDLFAAQLQAGAGHSGIAPIVFTYAADTPVLRPGDAETLGAVGEVTSMTPQVLIDHQLVALGEHLIVSWDYRAGCFPPGVVEDMFDAYIGLLEKLGRRDWSAAAPIELPEHSRLARRQRNATTAPKPKGLLYEAFREQVRVDSGRVALRWSAGEFDDGGDPVACVGGEVSYGALDRYARSVAGALADRYAPGSTIGIQLPKGPAQVVAVLGVLMAGCSYLPVGVDQPAERFARIRELSGISGLIRSGDIEAMIRCAPRQPVPADPDDTAYAIYTSGSTGEPKGVLVSHAAALNTVVDVNRRNGIGSDDSLLALSALDFDLSVYDIFGPLSCGASVVLIAERSRRDAFRWKEMVAEFGVTVWNSVPALLDMLLIAAGDKAAVLPSLRSVFVSGDWVSLDMPELLRHAAPGARLVAMGGATEAAIWSNEFVVTDVDPDWVSVPYGYPLSNQVFRVVDRLGQDRPDHVAGELWIGGAGVAQGYHNDPGLTADRFVADRLGGRWYRTGDLGCYWPDGTLQFLGRLDSQVKIGGHRVECGEIEHVLRGHPLVDNAAVVPIHGNTALGAVIVCTGAAALTDSTADELRGYVAARLPHYMTPKSFLTRAELPLTGNGKVDRGCAAKEIEASVLAMVRGSAGGLNPVEEMVAAAWSEVLGVPITGRDDNFFALGGDSLRATQVAADLRRQGVLGAEVGQLLGRQTLGEYSAGCVVGVLPSEVASPAVPAGAQFPLTRLQQAYVLGSAGMNGSVRAPTYFSIVLASDNGDGGIDVDRLVAVVGRCVDEFELLRCGLDTDTSQRVHAGAAPVGITVITGADPDVLLHGMGDAPFDPRAVPVIQCFALSDSARYVGLLVNYLSLDARSLATVIATIVADYQQLPRPRQIDCGADVFARFAAAPVPADAVRGAVSAPPTLPVSGRRFDSARVGFARSSFTLDPLEFGALRDRAAQLRVTPNALIFEAFTAALHAVGAGDRFAIVIPTSHRPDYAPADREVLGNFTQLALCQADYTVAQPGSATAVMAAQQQLWRAVGSHGDATAQLATLRTPGSTGYPVVFTSTLGLIPPGSAGLSSVRTLTLTPGVWLDCQVEDHAGGARLSWDTATGVIDEASLALAFKHFERAVRRHAGQADTTVAEQDWAGAVLAAAARLCEPGHVLPQYTELVARWPRRSAAGHDTTRAARKLADIVTGAASPQTLIGDPQLAPEAMLLADERLLTALDDLGERVFAHARTVGRRLRVLEVGSRTGLITGRLTELIGTVVEQYLCFEPNPILAEIAAGRAGGSATRQITSPDQASDVDVVICCGSLHQLPDAGAVLEALTVADGGWLWVAEICEVTSATLASAAILSPVSSEALPAADQWWRLVAQHRWRPVQMTQDGPGLTIIAQRGHARRRPANAAPMAMAPESAPVVDETVLAAVAAIWQRHLNIGSLPASTDDFFLLGGDSLVATRVYADLRAAGFARLALVDLFNYPTLGELVAHAGAPTTPPPVPAAAATYDATEFPLTVVQQAYLAGRVGGFMLSGVAAHCYFEFEAGDFDWSQFETAARQLIAYHPGLRTTVSADGQRFKAVVHPAPIEPVVYEYHNVRARMRNQVIDVTTRPGIEFGVQPGKNGRCIVGISMDNIMLDGTSMMIVLAQLDYLYRGGTVDDLPILRTSFAQYVSGRPELWPGADESALSQLAASRDYWRARLPSLPAAPELAPMQVILGIEQPLFDRVEAVVAQSDWERITRACRAERVTASAFLLANYARTLAEWSETAHFCVNVTLFDRDPTVAGIEDVIGDFTSLLLLECHVDAAASIWEQARRLQRQLLTDLPHRNADAVWLQRELLHHHGRPASAVYPVVFTSGLGLVDTARASAFEFGGLVYGLSQTPQTLLDFQMWERAGSLALSWDFVTQAISPDAARRHLDLMVAAMVAAVAAAAGGTPPDRHVEHVLAICASALGVPRVTPGDNFFRLGGDSVTATKAVEALSREVSASATLRLLFEHPVIGEFAEQLRANAPATVAEFEEGVL